DVEIARAVERDGVRRIQRGIRGTAAVAAESRAAVPGDAVNAHRRGVDEAHAPCAILDEIEIACFVECEPARTMRRNVGGELAIIRAATGDGEDRLRRRDTRVEREGDDENTAHGFFRFRDGNAPRPEKK